MSLVTSPTLGSFNIQEELENLLGPEPFIIQLPANIEGITNVLWQYRIHPVQDMAVRLRRTPSDVCKDEQYKKLAAFLAAMNNLEMIDPRMKSKAKLDEGLKLIFDPKNKFPVEYARIAKFIFDKLESERWGADEVEADDAAEEVVPVTSLVNGAKSSSSTATTTNEGSSKSELTARKEKGSLKYSDFPDDSDPIYGIKGIMHGILRIRSEKMTSYQLNPNYKPKDAKVFGHNGLQVGVCWPSQMALLRDGAHGQRMGGISGSITAGTYSIVVSGMYDDLDKDQGDRIFYSGSNSHENTKPEPITSNKTKALERSAATRKPVRVFRSAHGKWIHCPKAGLRYDGLYIVMGMSIEKNGKGGAYKRFRLERIKDQDTIKINEPCQALINLFNRVQDGYTRTRPRLVPVQT